MNLQQLYYFQKIAECQQYTQAARELHVTQATLSYAISNLEKELNVRLFDRKGKSVQLTEHGAAYLSCVRDALQALERGEQMLRNADSPAKTLVKLNSLGSVRHLALRMISDLSAEDAGQHLRFELSYSNASSIEQQLLRREADLGIATTPTTTGIASRLIGYQENVIAVPKKHPWARKSSIPLSALNGQKFIAYTQDCVIRGYYDSILKAAHVQPEIFAETRLHSNILDMVAYGMGISMVPKMETLEEQHDLRFLGIQDEIPPRAIYLLWAEDAVLPAEVEQIRQHLAERTDLSKYL